MGRDSIPKYVERQLYVEALGRCMNPACQCKLFAYGGDIVERAHIVPYCDTADNSFENLVILCPNCHTNFDKNHAFTVADINNWKRIRKGEIERIFSRRFSSFDEMKNEVVPLLLENQRIFDTYYLGNQRGLWDTFENQIIVNNRKLKSIFENNMNLFQSHRSPDYSNAKIVQDFIMHIDEFEATRVSKEKIRSALFPQEILSLFGIEPLSDSAVLPHTKAIETLIDTLERENAFDKIVIGCERPYIQFRENGETTIVYLNDRPRLLQLLSDYGSFRNIGKDVRLESLNFVLKYIGERAGYEFIERGNLRKIRVAGVKDMLFVYEYTLSKVGVMNAMPDDGMVVVNLYNWNGRNSISSEAYEFARQIGVTLLREDELFGYIKNRQYL